MVPENSDLIDKLGVALTPSIVVRLRILSVLRVPYGQIARDGVDFLIRHFKAIGTAGERQQMPEIARATTMYRELCSAFNEAASREMRPYDGKFSYLSMLLKEDPAWQLL